MIYVFKYVLIQVWMLRLLIIGVLTCTMGASGTYHPYVFALKNCFHHHHHHHTEGIHYVQKKKEKNSNLQEPT